MTSTRIEAEDYLRAFDTTPGNAGVPYPDADSNAGDADIYTTGDSSGYMLGNIKPGEWLEYDLSLPQSGTYDMVARVVSTKRVNHEINAILGGQRYTFNFNRTGNSWESWADVVIPNVSLIAGAQTLRLEMGSSKFNLNYIEIVPTVSSPAPTPTPVPAPTPLPGAIAFVDSNYTIAEEGGFATLTLTRGGGSDGPVSVDVVTTGGTAIAPDDYTEVLQTITFADGATRRSVRIPIIDDSLDEGDETLRVSLVNPTNGATLATPIQSVITIIDNDEPAPPPAPTPTPPSPTPPPNPSPSPTPTTGAAIRVEAEDYSQYFDTSSGNAGGVYRTDDVDIYPTADSSGYTVAGIKAGEWLEQSVTIPETGLYSVVARVASPKSLAHSLTVDIGGQTTELAFGKTGNSWESWQNVTIPSVSLSAGTQPLRMTMGSSKFSLNYVELVPAGGPAPTPSPTPTPPIPPTPSFDLGRIMPLGDSITDGFSTFRGGYRDRLEDLLTNNGIGFDFVGGLRNGPNSLSDRDHEGHSGFRLDEIAASATSWVQAQDPDIILLLGGTNDVNQNYQVNTAPDRLSSLIDQVLAAAPQSHVVVSTIPPTTKRLVQPRVETYNAEIPGVVAEKVAVGQSVSLVDNYGVLTTADLGDNLHPNQDGYNKMAQVWFDELLGRVPDFSAAALPGTTEIFPSSSTGFSNLGMTASSPALLTLSEPMQAPFASDTPPPLVGTDIFPSSL